MDGIPPILSSAQTLFQTSFARANTAAQKIADDPGDPAAYVDLINAKGEAGAAGILVHAYEEMTNDLFDAVRGSPRDRRSLDVYA